MIKSSKLDTRLTCDTLCAISSIQTYSTSTSIQHNVHLLIYIMLVKDVIANSRTDQGLPHFNTEAFFLGIRQRHSN